MASGVAGLTAAINTVGTELRSCYAVSVMGAA